MSDGPIIQHIVETIPTASTEDSLKTDNSAFTDGTDKVQPAGFIYDEVAGTALTENDVGAARMDVKRSIVVTIEDATTRGRRATVSSGGAVSVDTELPAAAALADAASAAPTTATVGSVPLLMNATTVDRQRAVVNSLDSTGTGIAAAGLVGQLDDTSTGSVTENQFAPVRITARRALAVDGVTSGLLSQRTSNTDGNATALSTFGATSGKRNYITAISVYNSHASTSGYIDFTDGSGGTVLWTMQLPAGGGGNIALPSPGLFRTTANTGLYFDVSTAISTVYISVSGFQDA